MQAHILYMKCVIRITMFYLINRVFLHQCYKCKSHLKCSDPIETSTMFEIAGFRQRSIDIVGHFACARARANEREREKQTKNEQQQQQLQYLPKCDMNPIRQTNRIFSAQYNTSPTAQQLCYNNCFDANAWDWCECV